jgi:hypothetical protein
LQNCQFSFGEKIHISDVLLGFGVRGIIERAELDYFGATDIDVLFYKSPPDLPDVWRSLRNHLAQRQYNE